MPTPAPRQIRTRRFPPSGSSVDVTRGDSRPTTFRSPGDISSNVKALGMVPFRSSHQHGPPLLGRVQVSPCSPTSSLLCSPPTPCLLRPPLRFPLRVAYLDAGACSVPCGRRHVRSPTCRASETGHRLSVKPGSVEERRGPPRLRGRPLRACHGRTPRRIRPLLAHFAQRALLPSSNSAPWASGKMIGFGAACPMARTFACLRIAEAISDAGARLATGSGGLTLGRAGFAPAGR